ncbi:hypothetical protein F6B41_02785 [Microbacterium lushaniae]|nr:hypothetical protein F6B41_28500 [Microbacterium lushaniae]KAA9158831.1 hypothetical protein F6B41_02785 [Microbacterium lushaniae]
MSYFTPTNVNHLNGLDNIHDGYVLAGLPVPTRVDFLSTRLAEEPTAYDVAVKYATQALDGDVDENTILTEAIAAITRAQAVEKFRDVYDHTITGLALERIDQMRDQAVKDLTPTFNKTVKQLTTVVGKLDDKKPLSPEVAFDQDTTAEYKQAVALLTTLAGYASIHITASTHGDVPHHIARLLPLISIGETTREIGQWQHGSFLSANQGALTPATGAVRALDRDASRDIDQTVVDIARGKYNGVSFKLADTNELAQRIERAATALVREHSERANNNLVRVM